MMNNQDRGTFFEEEYHPSTTTQQQSSSWSCPRCTLLNAQTSLHCEACDYQRQNPSPQLRQRHHHSSSNTTQSSTTNSSRYNNNEGGGGSPPPPPQVEVTIQEVDPRMAAASGVATMAASFGLFGGLVGGPIGAAIGGVVGAAMGLGVSSNSSSHITISTGSTVRVRNRQGRRLETVTIRNANRRGHGPTVTDRLILQMLLLNATNQGISNPDTMSYDELLERFGVGTENRRGASPELVDSLPLTKVDETILEEVRKDEHPSTCNICLEDFQKDDEIRKLPNCSHTFHKQCIDRWVSQVASCPTCKKELERPSSSS